MRKVRRGENERRINSGFLILKLVKLFIWYLELLTVHFEVTDRVILMEGYPAQKEEPFPTSVDFTEFPLGLPKPQSCSAGHLDKTQN